MTVRFMFAIIAIMTTSMGWRGIPMRRLWMPCRSPDRLPSQLVILNSVNACPENAAPRCRSRADEADARDLGRLVDVNRKVNLIPAMTDMERYGVEEYWTYPVDAADCEDFVLQKRKLLMERGFSPSNLLITVVLQPDGSGHAVLAVRSGLGDFVLDNLRAEIRKWSETEYTYLKRQDSRDPGKWVKINDGRDTIAVGGIR